MNVEIRPSKTAAEQQLAALWEGARDRLPGPSALREAAFRRFDAAGLPHRRMEEWKYTDLRGLLREARPLATTPDAETRARAAQAGGLAGDIDARRLTFADGVFLPEHSNLSDLEPGLSIRPMSEALSQGDPVAIAHFDRQADGDATLALNTALMKDGALIHVAAGSIVERPIHLVFAATGQQPASIFTRSLLVVEEGARAMLVESHESSAAHQVVTALDLVVGDSAHVDHIKLTAGDDASLHVSNLTATVGARARFNEFLFTVGGGTVRNQLFVRLEGDGTVAGVRGVTLLKGRQHADTAVFADHAARACQSREVFKMALDGESRGVFQGRISVRQAAQKTDAKMMSQALILSEGAEANQKPELEIFADDVQCGHGSTCGTLDRSLKFYLMARGIPEPEAEALLIQAFVGEAVEGIEHAGLRDALMEHIAAWLRARQRQGG